METLSAMSVAGGSTIVLYGLQVAVTTVTEAERLLFRKLPYPGIYHCVARYGYGDTVKMGTPFVTRLLDKVGAAAALTSLAHQLKLHCIEPCQAML